MTHLTLILRSLRFHARAHLGVLLGAAIGSAALVGALIVGDSVRLSLHNLALARLGKTDFALASNDRLFRDDLGERLTQSFLKTAPPLPKKPDASEMMPNVCVLELPAIATTSDDSARANHVQVLGVHQDFWRLANTPPTFGELAADAVALNTALAEHLKVKVNDTVLLRIQKPSLLSRDALISSQNDSAVALRLKVQAIVSDDQLGRFSLQASQISPFNAFVNLNNLQLKAGQTNRANLLLCETVYTYFARSAAERSANAASFISIFESSLPWQLPDAQLDLRPLPNDAGTELRSDRVFLDPAVVTAAREVSTNAQPVLTYFVNELRSPPFATPYSMVTAIGAPIVPPNLATNEIIINSWLAEDLNASLNDPVSLTYYVIGNGRALQERREDFRIRSIIPMSGAAADRGLMPDFPGIAEADSSSDWDAGFPIDLKRIRSKDEQYWKQFRGTPKAFVSLAAGEQMWSNRFGQFTAIRFPKSAGSPEQIQKSLLPKIDPASVGLSFQPVREQALAASSQAVDFGGLFIGFSFFLIVAALLLMGLLFQFSLEQRATEIGTLLALGFRPKQVRRLFLGEGALLALAGGIIGAVGGILYARAMLLGLATIWRGAVGTSALQFHATAQTLFIGTFSGVIVSLITIWFTLRKQGRRPARELLAQGAETSPALNRKKSWGLWIGPLAFLGAIAMVATDLAKGQTPTADTFFSAGSLLLIAGLSFCAVWLARLARREKNLLLTLRELALRACGRRRKRSLATIGLLACGAFLIVAIGAFRIDATQGAHERSSGTGGFEFIGESAFPVTYDLNSHTGREFYNLDVPLMQNVRAVPFRVHDGDDASCLNLNRAQQPRLLGVDPTTLETRNAFTFAEILKSLPQTNAWSLLRGTTNETQSAASVPNEIPAIADQNSILWAMGKKIGDTVDYADEHGHPFKVRLVAALANSVLQGNLIIDEAEFVKKFPSESGYRMFLIDAPSNQATGLSALLTRALQDQGLELTPAVQRLNAYNAVQNTYLSTFQILGGLGLLLGSAGLGIVVLRNVHERRGELALLLAVGFRPRAIARLVISEHGALLALGLLVGVIAAALGVLPALLAPGSHLPWASLTLTLAFVLANGLLWTWLATRLALRGRLLDALRNE